MKKALTHLQKSDPVLASIIERVGPYKITYREPQFETLARAIVFQQLSTKAASTIYQRFEAASGGKITPEAIQGLTVGEMRRCGLSKQKIGYIRDLAGHALEGKLVFEQLHAMQDEEVIAVLTDIKGIGVWTAHMFLMFALRRPNVLPTGDLGIQSAIKRAYRKRAMPKAHHIEKIARNWHPYCSMASWYLWRSLELPASAAAVEKTKTNKPQRARRTQRGIKAAT